MLTRSNKDHNGHNTYYGLDNQNIAKLSILSSPKLKNIDSVNLSCTSLRTVNFEGFTNFEHITEVNLSENFIQNVDFTLVKLRYLKSINLSNNLINTLSPQPADGDMEKTTSVLRHSAHKVFAWNANLETINLSYNRLREINECTFQKQERLKSLILSHNNIQNIDSNAFLQNRQLEVLHLGYNNLYESANVLDKHLFQNQFKLQVLDLEANYLTELNRCTFMSLVSLTELNLSVNRLRCLDSKLFTFNTAIKVLNLNCNEIGFIHSKFFYPLIEMETLHLENTAPLLKLGLSSFLLNEKLVTIHLSNYILGFDFNRFTHIYFNGTPERDNFIPQMKYLRTAQKVVHLQLRRAFQPDFKIKRCDFLPFWHLLVLDLSDNDLRVLETLVFADLVVLETLNVSASYFEDRLKGPYFTKNNRLNSLILNFCAISHLCGSIFLNLRSLVNLELNWNTFEWVSNDVFWELPKLKCLSMIGCQVKSLPLCLLDFNFKLKKIHFEKSFIDCLEDRHFAKLLSLREIHISAHTYLEEDQLMPLIKVIKYR